MKRAALALLSLHVLRLALAPLFELAPQEAYYFLYAQHPALSYFDHPPAIAWLVFPFASVLGRHPMAPRLACWLATLCTGLAFAALARRTLPRARRPWALAVMGTTMLASVIAIFATPDVPLLLFWTLSLLLLHRAVFEGGKLDWIAGGVLMGLAFDAKYTAVFLQLGLLLFLLIAPRQRRWLRTPWPYLSVAAAHLAMAPVYVWNAQHGFASFLFQSAHRAGNVGGPGVINLGKLLATQSFLVLPPLLCAIAWAIVRGADLARAHRERRSREQLVFLACFAVPALALFGALSLFSLVKPNWLMPAWLTGTLLAVRLLPRKKTVVWKAQLGFALPAFALAAVELCLYPVPVKSDDTWYGWKELAAQVEARAAQERAGFAFADDEYKTTAELRFYSKLPAYAGNLLGRSALQFDYLGEDVAALAGQDGLFLDSRPLEDSPDRSGETIPALAARCREVAEEDPILLRAGDRVVRKFLVWRCRGYSGPGSSSK